MYGATTRMSSSVSSCVAPVASVNAPAVEQPLDLARRSASASSARALAVVDVVDLEQPQARARAGPASRPPGARSPASDVQPRRRTSCRDTKRQTSGCIRHVWSRNTPRSGGTVSRVAEQVLEHRDARPARVVPWLTCASCCGSPSRTTLRAAPRHRPARRRARPGPPRRRTARRPPRAAPRAPTATACRRSGCTSLARREVGVARARTRCAALVDRLRVAGARLLEPAEREPLLLGRDPRPRRAGCAIALCEVAATPTRLPSRSSCTISRAPV